jgi:hypothetical protein
MECTPETLRKWVREAERDQGVRRGVSSDERESLKALERENRKLRRTNEILRKASAFSAKRISTTPGNIDAVKQLMINKGHAWVESCFRNFAAILMRSIICRPGRSIKKYEAVAKMTARQSVIRNLDVKL